MKIQEQVPLAPLTTLGVGGPARYFAEGDSVEAIREAVHFADSRNLPLFILGGGSNLLIADSGFNGLVLRVVLRGILTSPTNAEGVLLRAGAGEEWDSVVEASVQGNCSGIECLSGIPGTVGGTPVQNVGAYGQEVAESIQHVEALDVRTSEVRTFSGEQCGFAYRTSRFNTVDRGRYIILNVTYRLVRNGAPSLRYGDLQKQFSGLSGLPSLSEVRSAVLSIRRSKGMVLDEGDPNSRSAGSFFKNPVLSDDEFRELEDRVAGYGLKVPSYPALSSQRKVSAAWLVEQAGFHKGTTRGPVGISTRHSLAIVTHPGAKASDVVVLKNEIQETVHERFGILLHPEPVFLGFEAAPPAK